MAIQTQKVVENASQHVQPVEVVQEQERAEEEDLIRKKNPNYQKQIVM